MENNTELERDILALSSGTIASLTGYRDYESIDYVHTDFLTYVRVYLRACGSIRRSWDNWVLAWNDFSAYRTRTMGNPSY